MKLTIVGFSVEYLLYVNLTSVLYGKEVWILDLLVRRRVHFNGDYGPAMHPHSFGINGPSSPFDEVLVYFVLFRFIR